MEEIKSHYVFTKDELTNKELEAFMGKWHEKLMLDQLNQSEYGARMNITLDEKIHDKIMGETLSGRTPPYSTDMDEAMKVVEKINLEFSLYTDTGTPQEWRATFGNHYAIAETAPHAICLAALKTKGL